MIEALVPLQATGDPTSTIGIILVLGVVGWLVLERFNIDLGGVVPSVGGGGIMGFLTSRMGLALVGLTALLAVQATGAFNLPAGASLQLVIGIELVALAVILIWLDAWSFRLFAVTATAVVVIGLSAMGEPVLGTIANSPMGPLLAVAAGYAVYKWYNSDDTREIVVRGQVRGDNE